MHRHAPGLVVTVVVLLGALTGCATAGTGASPYAGTPSPTPTPTAACPEQPGVELPPECAPYDPDAAMAQNDRYRERMPLDEANRVANEALLANATTGLAALQASGTVTEDAVRTALEQAGAVDVQTRGAAQAWLFGAAIPGGGCLYGEIDGATGELSAELGGFILDGGCLPAQ